MNTSKTPTARDADSRLDQAASLLVHLGRHLDDQTDPGTPLHCLLAADYLICAGAHTEQLQVPLPNRASVTHVIRHILGLLATLPADLINNDLVLDAVAETRNALAIAV